MRLLAIFGAGVVVQDHRQKKTKHCSVAAASSASANEIFLSFLILGSPFSSPNFKGDAPDNKQGGRRKMWQEIEQEKKIEGNIAARETKRELNILNWRNAIQWHMA